MQSNLRVTFFNFKTPRIKREMFSRTNNALLCIKISFDYCKKPAEGLHRNNTTAQYIDKE